MLRRSCEIPELPFENRGEEIEAVKAFCDTDSTGASVLIIQAASGVGKSRFLKEMAGRVADSGWATLTVAPLTHADPLRDLMGVMSQEISRVISAWNVREVATLAKQRLVRLRRGFSKLASGGAKLVPIAGGVLSAGVDEVAGAPLKPVSLEARWHAIRELAEIALEVSKRQRLLLIVDDLHKFDGLELDDLARFLSALDLSSDRQIRVIVASQPRSSINPNFDAWIDNVNRSGLLAGMDFDALDDRNIRLIAAATIENPKEAEALIALASGNPQVFLEQLLKLNAAGELVAKGKLLVLPHNTIENKALSQSLWETIAGDGVRRRLLAILAIGRAPLTLDDLGRCYKRLGASDAIELQQLATVLEREGILAWLEDATSDARFVLRFRHDLMRQQIRSAILDGSIGERLEFAAIATSIVAIQLEPYTEEPVRFLKRASDLNAALANTDARSLELLSDLCDVLSLNRSPDYISCSLGLIRLATDAGRHDIVAQTGRDIVGALASVLDDGSLRFRQYLERILAAQYRMGWFSQVVESGQSAASTSASISYHVGASMLVLKDKEGVTRNIVEHTKAAVARFSKSNWRPQIDLLHALALQETGRLIEADEHYKSVGEERPQGVERIPGWIVFDLASTLFVSREDALRITKDAAARAKAIGDQRVLGLALNNLGICEIQVGKLDAAKAHFLESEAALETGFAHEAVFPQNNLAGLDLLAGAFQSARSRLHGAIFRTQSDNYSTTLRLNLALATFGAGYGFDEDTFQSMTSRADVAENTFLLWLIHHARTYLKVFSAIESERLNVLSSLREDTARFHEIGLSRIYWNRLTQEIASNLNVDKFLFKEDPSDRPSSGIDSRPELIRPAFMAFGRA